MPFKVTAVKNGREIVSDGTWQDRNLAEAYKNQALRMGCQEAHVIFVDDIEARKIKMAKANGL